jgi:hypothetical protein
MRRAPAGSLPGVPVEIAAIRPCSMMTVALDSGCASGVMDNTVTPVITSGAGGVRGAAALDAAQRIKVRADNQRDMGTPPGIRVDTRGGRVRLRRSTDQLKSNSGGNPATTNAAHSE